MKRSKEIKLTLMLASASAVVAGCSPDITTYSYEGKDPAQCIAEKRVPAEECKNAFLQAKNETPRFEDKKDCQEAVEDSDGVCEFDNTDRTYSPSMSGVIIASNHTSGGIYRARNGYYGQDGYSISSPFSSSAKAGKPGYSFDTALAPTPQKIQTRTSVVSRGGFGGGRSYVTGSGRSFGG